MSVFTFSVSLYSYHEWSGIFLYKFGLRFVTFLELDIWLERNDSL